ncbi:hypothetical protein SH139x_004568 [Planctomycetaceae bacterium SH139]
MQSPAAGTRGAILSSLTVEMVEADSVRLFANDDFFQPKLDDMSRHHDRRQFLRVTSFAGIATFAAAGQCFPEAMAADPAGVKLEPASGELYRVRMELEVNGNVHLPKDPVLSKKQARALPLKAKSIIDFEERIAYGATGQADGANRYYYEASSDAVIGDNPIKQAIRMDARRVVARRANGPEVIYSERTFLTHEELDLLQTPINSLAINQALPTGTVRVGGTWSPDAESLARLFNLDAVQKTTVVGEVMSVDAKEVKLQLQGRLDAAVTGVPTVLDLAGKITFDRRSNAITWFAVALREQREIGVAKPGFEVAATLKLIRQPLEKANANREPSSIDLTAAIPRPRMLVKVESEATGFNAFLDRPWRTVNDAPGLTTLRMVVDDQAIAQCDLRPLTNMKPGQQLTLEGFQTEIKRSLGKQFGEFLEAEEGLNGGELRTLRVAVLGQVQDVPVQWVFLQFSDDQGRRLGATFSLESSRVETFAGSDAQLANSLHFQEIVKPNAKGQQAAAPDAKTIR